MKAVGSSCNSLRRRRGGGVLLLLAAWAVLATSAQALADAGFAAEASTATVIPEPATLIYFGVAAAALFRRRRQVATR